MIIKDNVLFLECGSSGQGGSYISLKDHLEIMADQLGTKVIVLVNESIYESEFKSLGCEVIKINHPIYSNDSKRKWIFNKCLSVALKISPFLGLSVYRLFERHFSTKLVKIIKKYDIKLLHLNNQPIRNLSGFMTANRANVALVSHIRTLHTYSCSKTFANYINQTNPVFIAISQAVQTEWGKYNLDSEVIYNPVLLNYDVAQQKKEYDLIYVGRLVEGKGLKKLLEEISLFDVPPKLALLGEGPLRIHLIEMVEKINLGSSVSFLGYTKNVVPYILKSKVLVLPSENEGMGRVIIEAMKIGVPVIANKSGGMEELVKHHQTGLLCDASIKGNLFKTTRHLLENRILRNSLASTAKKWVNMNFGAIRYKEEMSDQYKRSKCFYVRCSERG